MSTSPLPVMTSAQHNETVVNGWVSEPSNTRGTFSILSSCILTLTLCVYTAIHLNIPSSRDSELRKSMKTMKWVFLGIFAPELVVFVAWRQYISVTALETTVKRLRSSGNSLEDAIGQGRPKKSSDILSKSVDIVHHPWTRVHSYYANMGGFALDLDVSDLDERKKPGLLVLTPRGVKLLAECGYLPNISEEEILDKSKTDCLGRLISLLQAIWMLAQTLGRVAANLPVTLLEVNTLAHVLCALIIFFLWWKKPKQINEPTLLRGRWVREIGAYMFMSSQVSGWKSQNPGILKKTWVKAEFSALAFELTSEPEAGNQLSADSTQFAQSLGEIATLTEPAGDAAHVTGSFKFRSFSAKPTEGDEKKDVPINSDYIQEIFSGKTPDRWDLAARAIHRYPAIKTRLIPLQKTGCSTTAIWQEPMTKELVVRCAGNWPDHSLLRDMSGFVMGVVLWFASMAYGGLHSAAWHHYFPSKLEAWLWRASSVCIASAGLIWSVINLLAQISTSFKAYWKDVIELRAHWISLVGLGSLATVCGTAYLMARAFLVVEAFISLRSLPASAYETPDWTQLFPHL